MMYSKVIGIVLGQKLDINEVFRVIAALELMIDEKH